MSSAIATRAARTEPPDQPAQPDQPRRSREALLFRLGAALIGLHVLDDAVFSNRLPPQHLEELVPKIAPRPILLIHAGERDVGTLNPDYFRAAREPKQIWRVPAGGHTDGTDVRPGEYESRVIAFFDDALLAH